MHDDLLRQLRHMARHQSGQLSVLLLDIDHFKQINDTYGHVTGDAALRQMVKRLQTNLRAEDILYRYGGEEFVILAPDINLGDAAKLAERLRLSLQDKPVDCDGVRLKITISVGVTSVDGGLLQEHADTPRLADVMMQIADHAMYVAKRSGRNRVRTEAFRHTSPVVQ